MLARLETVGPSVRKAVPMGNDDCVLSMVHSDAFSLQKISFNGTPEWRIQLPLYDMYPTWDLTPASNGDVLVAAHHSTLTNWGAMDTVIIHLDIWRIDPSGAFVWHRRVDQEPYIGETGTLSNVRIFENEHGDIFLITRSQFLTTKKIGVIKLGPSGEVSWARLVGDPSADMNFPELVDLPSTVFLATDGVGGCRLVASGPETEESAVIISLNPSGVLAWARHYSYLGEVALTDIAQPVVDPIGDTWFQMFLTAYNGGLHLIKVSEDGALTGVEKYGGGLFCRPLVNDQDTIRMAGAGRIITLSSNGDPVSRTYFTSFPDASDSTYSVDLGNIDILNGHTCLSGTYTATPLGSGFPTTYPALAQFRMADPPTCGRITEPITVPHESLPDSLLSLDPLASVAADTLELDVTVVLDSAVNVSPIGTVDLCGLFVGITEQIASKAALDIYPNPASYGSLLNIECDNASRYMLCSSTGAVLRNISASKDPITSLSCEGLAPGLYPIVAFDHQGQRLATAKVEVR